MVDRPEVYVFRQFINAMFKDFLIVGLGGGIGSVLRYACNLLIQTKTLPVSTLLVNITGSFIIGLAIAASNRDAAFSGDWKLFVATGICGGFTTFSAFSAENMQLLQQGRTGLALLYIISSILLGIAATFLGYIVMNREW